MYYFYRLFEIGENDERILVTDDVLPFKDRDEAKQKIVELLRIFLITITTLEKLVLEIVSIVVKKIYTSGLKKTSKKRLTKLVEKISLSIT